MKKILAVLLILIAIPVFGETITYTVDDENCLVWEVTTLNGHTSATCIQSDVPPVTLPACTVDKETIAGPYEIFEITIEDTDTCFAGNPNCKVLVAVDQPVG
jgi:hypothetical protein